MVTHRRLTDWERRVLLRLLEPEFPGRDALRDQLDDIVVSPIDDNRSLDMACGGTVIADVEKRIPTEGEASDLDGTTIHFLLHVVSGRLNRLEIFKDDSSRVARCPEPDDIQVLIL